jgi:DNA repair protein RadC
LVIHKFNYTGKITKKNPTNIFSGRGSGKRREKLADLNTTKKIMAAGQLLEIQVSNHLIITAESLYSMADEVVL